MSTQLVTIDDIREAVLRIAPIAHRTPVMTSATFDGRTGVRAFFKCENLQRGGAFKVRGAANLIFSLNSAELSRGVVAYSSGNHAQGTALAARYAGAKCTVVMPTDAPPVKVEATRAAGAEIVTYDRLTEDREAVTRSIFNRTGATVVPPYNHKMIIAGQGTVAFELLHQVRQLGVEHLDALVVCIGGGGLASGCAIAAKALNPDIRVFGVEPEQANDAYLSLKAGRRITIPPPETIADGLRTPSTGELTFPILQALIDDVLLVSEDEIRAAMQFFFSRMKLVVEPSGAVPAAAVLHGKLPEGCERVGIIISGGNADIAAFS